MEPVKRPCDNVDDCGNAAKMRLVDTYDVYAINNDGTEKWLFHNKHQVQHLCVACYEREHALADEDKADDPDFWQAKRSDLPADEPYRGRR